MYAYTVLTMPGVSKRRGYSKTMLPTGCPGLFLIHSALLTAVFSIKEITCVDGAKLCFSHSTMLLNCSGDKSDSVKVNKVMPHVTHMTEIENCYVYNYVLTYITYIPQMTLTLKVLGDF